jgi:hypothetical protein
MSSPSFSRRFPCAVLRDHVPILDADKQDPEDLVTAKASKDCAYIKDGSWILEQFSLGAHLLEAPELSTLYLRAKLELQQRGIYCVIESVLENFVVMSLGVGTSVYVLVYDAAKNSLSLLPSAMEAFVRQDYVRRDLPIPFRFMGQAAVLQRDGGSYVLLNLGLCFDDFCSGYQVVPRSAILFRWSSAVKKWTQQDASFNSQTLLPPAHPKRLMYQVEAVFTFKGKVFWVDLLHGAIVCDMLSTDACCKDRVELDFLHFPDECKGMSFEGSYPKERRTMGPVGNSIKFISVVTTNGDAPNDHTLPKDVVLQSWTLGADFRSWTRDNDMELHLPLLWKSDSYKRESLPEAVPLYPVLKADEDGVLYLLLGDYYVDWIGKVRLCRETECVISIDMRRKSLLSRSRRAITTGLIPYPEVESSKEFYPDMPHLFGLKLCTPHSEWSDGLGQRGKKE